MDSWTWKLYKGASKVTIDSVVKTGYLTRNLPTGVELSNGGVKVTSGSTTDNPIYFIFAAVRHMVVLEDCHIKR